MRNFPLCSKCEGTKMLYSTWCVLQSYPITDAPPAFGEHGYLTGRYQRHRQSLSELFYRILTGAERSKSI